MRDWAANIERLVMLLLDRTLRMLVLGLFKPKPSFGLSPGFRIAGLVDVGVVIIVVVVVVQLIGDG